MLILPGVGRSSGPASLRDSSFFGFRSAFCGRRIVPLPAWCKRVNDLECVVPHAFVSNGDEKSAATTIATEKTEKTDAKETMTAATRQWVVAGTEGN